jgi:hypothetical protein
MNLSAPTKPVWLVGVIAGVLGISVHFASVPVVTPNQFLFVAVGFVVLALATVLKGF